MTLRAALFACALIAAPATALAAPAAPPPAAAIPPGAPRAPQVAVTQHTIKIAGQAVRYTATVAENFVPGPDGKPAAALVTIGYVREGVKDRASRPVMFVFNGGPGASSSPLHMSAFGPRRIVDGPGGKVLADNAYSPLDAVDLVFVDPVSTGVSRPFPGVDGQPFYSISGDAASVKSAIQAWLKANGREGSPVYLCGESYGTTRAGQIVAIGADLHLSGVLLFSMTSGPTGPDLPYMATFPTFADAAAFHGKGAHAGEPVAQVFEGSARFAREQLVPALLLGDALPAADKQAMAEKMSAWLGLPADFIASKDLKISKRDFMLTLLKDKGLRTGQLDTRATGELARFATRKPPYDDPSMSGGPTGAAASEAKPSRGTGEIIDDYLAQELKFQTTEKYRSLNLDINAKWKYDGREPGLGDPASQVGRAMREQPKLRLFWASGYYDVTTPMYAGRYALDHAGIAQDRLTVAAFPTGHSIFETETALGAFTAAVKAFDTAGS